MRRMIGNSKLVVEAAAVLLLMTAEAMAQTQRQVVVSIPDRKLALVENGEVKKIYAVAVGRSVSPSPQGTFQVVNRLENPTYYHKGTVIGPGAENPLGTRWVGLNEKGYGIHGTNAPRSIGKAASHGCIRMAKRDLEEFFKFVRVGDEVEILGERDETTAKVFGAPAGVVVATARTESTTTMVAGGGQ